MWHYFHDSDFEHKRAKWWHVLNVVTCFDFTGGLSGGGTLYKVFCGRIWSYEIFRIAIRWYE